MGDGINLVLKRTGQYQPEAGNPAEQLTNRQKEIVWTAISMGYYDVSRRTTQRDLTAELGLSRATIGEHLREQKQRSSTW